MTTALWDTVTLTITSCGVCGVSFAWPAGLETRARQDSSKWFYCPNGHSIHYLRSENEELKQRLASVQERANRTLADLNEERSGHEHTKRRLNGTRGVLKLTKRRIKAGACPCCHTRFVNLEKHMVAKHPDYGAERDSG